MHASLAVILVAVVAIAGLAITFIQLDMPKGLIDYDERVDSCAGGRLYTEAQVQGETGYFNYPRDTKNLHCYNYYTIIKRFGTPASTQPDAGRCYKEKCCWQEQPTYGVKHPAILRWMFNTLREFFGYSPYARQLRDEEIPPIPWICYQ